ncbi:MAG: M48 family metallopeptidase [Chitinophagaceae bacterium]|nr:MAG: M48 family metallopeptidase [Chitinophagaceae bacterium]
MITAKVRPYNNTSPTGSTMQNWTGTYKQTTASPGQEAEVYTENGYLVVDIIQSGDTDPRRWKMEHIDVRYYEHMDATFIRPFAGEPSCVVVPGKSAADRLNSLIGYREPPIQPDNNRKGWTRLLLLFTAVIITIIALYLLLVPYIAEKIATRVSPATEESFGESIYEGLALDGHVDSARSTLVNRFFAEMDVPSVYRVRIAVVNEPVVNAFALPGGRIVVYTGLLDKLDSYPELAALLGHEFSHVQLQHSTKSVFRRIAS